MKLLEFTKKSSANNYKQYRKLISKLVKEVLINGFIFKCSSCLQLMQLSTPAAVVWRVYLSARLPQRSGTRYFLTSIFHKVVTHFRCDGIFNDSFIADFQ